MKTRTDAVAQAVDPEMEAACAVCGGRLVTAPKVRLSQACLFECSACKGWTYWPRQSAAGQQSLHDSAEYFDHPYFELRRRISPALRKRCRQTFARIGRALDVGSLRGQPLLDVGCDTGVFLQCAVEESACPACLLRAASRFHMFYLILPSCEIRDALIAHLKARGMLSVFHYVPLAFVAHGAAVWRPRWRLFRCRRYQPALVAPAFLQRFDRTGTIGSCDGYSTVRRMGEECVVAAALSHRYLPSLPSGAVETGRCEAG